MAKNLGFSGAKKINETTLQPNVRCAFSGWEEQVIYTFDVKTVDEGDVVTTAVPIYFMGMIQPLGGEELTLKPEGQRSWEWLQIHAETSLFLKTDDAILVDEKRYKVMKVGPWKRNGYYEYHVIRDYEVTS